MTSHSFMSKKRSLARVVSLAALVVAFGGGCGKSSIRGGASSDGGTGLGADSKSQLGTDGVRIATDVGPCGSLLLPDVDCPDGTPSYFCVSVDGKWVWSYFCPSPGHDASSSPRDSGVDKGSADGGMDCAGGSLVDSGGEAGGGRADCAVITSKLAMQTQVLGSCTAVVRLDYSTLEIISHAFVCGKYEETDETAARKTASADAVFPYSSPAGQGKLISGPDPTDQWVFSASPGDFGGVAAVSATNGRTVFAGSIVWAGTGEIMVPSNWDTSDLGSGCGKPESTKVRGFNLSEGQATAKFTEAADVVFRTAIPAAFWQWGYVFGAVVLLYPRTVGAFDASKAEYIVLLDGGWLE